MTIFEEAVQLTARMSLVDKIRLLEHLSHTLKEAMETEAYRHISWEQFIDLTYGSLADDPIEREQPPFPDMRDTIE